MAVLDPAYQAALVKGGIVGLLTAGATFFAGWAATDSVTGAAVAAGAAFFTVVLARLPEEKITQANQQATVVLAPPEDLQAAATQSEVEDALRVMQERKKPRGQ